MNFLIFSHFLNLIEHFAEAIGFLVLLLLLLQLLLKIYLDVTGTYWFYWGGTFGWSLIHSSAWALLLVEMIFLLLVPSWTFIIMPITLTFVAKNLTQPFTVLTLIHTSTSTFCRSIPSW
jgi:hypothetical protein